MTLKANSTNEIPEQTKRVAKAAFPKANVYIKLRDELGTIYEDKEFEGLFSNMGQPAFSPSKLALITIFQFVENLSDRQTADAVRSRIDWKYALGLELEDSGFDASVLSEFRTRLLENNQANILFDQLVKKLAEAKLIKQRGKQRTDSTIVLANIHASSRLEYISETMRYALNTLAKADPRSIL